MATTTTTDPTVPPMKPGYQTTEFWLSSAATVLGLLFASGILADGSLAMRIAGLAASVLGTLGYTVSRGVVKAAGLLLLIAFAAGGVGLQAGCGARQRASAATKAFVDCQGADVASAVAELVPLAEQAVLVAIGGSGHVDTAQLKALAAPLQSDLGRCALAAAIAALAEPPPTTPGAPAAAPLAVNGSELKSAFSAVRVALGWAPVKLATGAVL